MKRLLTAVFFLISYPISATADIAVIVNKDNPIESISQRQLIDMYMGKYVAFPNGDMAVTYDYEKSHPLRGPFFLALTGRNESQINAYWSRIKFSGKVSPPQSFSSPSTILENIRNTPNAIGYVPADFVTGDVKVIYQIDD
ncbi:MULTISPECIES: hypothetical protein [Pseudoalteromonas]|uniref:hypothetical protein n=1 Tax=Pseudoalteromonas TaxID=53246 RepID=UPI00029B37DC|nr:MULTISPECIES: hypothetical protein [Pseudoalteromonas]MBR8845192.1 hypothetical protein [Pseudoalteromonas sp. JC3]MCG7554070.1 hypothetical protein [Pseudoalteromonas sp. Of11M-6]MCG9769788.1 hypothetical protein [Pseudoalteromonas piscicida]NSY34308.1 hypothetical protein [Pseudoalteromonas sp. JC28]QUI71749.1 hypothetical protein GSF13_19295 [Pseudoalteromonas sp. M8]